MKTTSDLLQLVNKAIEKNNLFKKSHSEGKLYNIFFISFSGNVNQISIDYCGVYDSESKTNRYDRCSGYLDKEENIQELYWFLKNRL